jgi:heat-inducible transcriptional repressor
MKEEAIKEAMNLLSKLTNYTSMALGADYRSELVKKMDFIPVNESEAVILIVTNQGHVSNQMIKIPNGLKSDDLKQVVKVLDEVLRNKPLVDVEKILNDEFARLQVKDLMDYHDQLLNTFVNAFSKFYKDNYYLSGMSNVFGQPEFNDVNKLKKFMEAFEEGEVMKLVGNTNGLTVRIGSENNILAMDDCTIISVPYKIDDEKVGTIAVIGPTRMEYKKVIPLVEYIAGNMTKLYKK